MRRKYRDRAPTRLDVMSSIAGPNPDVLQVLLLTLSEIHPRDEIVFWLLEQNLGPGKIAALERFCAGLGNITLRPLRIPDAEAFDRLKQLGGKPDSARFLWFVAHQHLPDDIKRVIYLDALDLLVTDDLVPLLNHPFLGRYLVACRESLKVPPLLIGPARRAHALGLPAIIVRHIAQGLLNSGSIVLNLDKLRRDDIGLDHYLAVAKWARKTLDLDFGDQGLFSLTHGSHYVQAHDRYNHRFYNERPGHVMQRPAVIHYAGQVIKPARWRLSPELEQRVLEHLQHIGKPEIALNDWARLPPTHIPYLRKWWDICARTPCHARIAPQATQRMTRALARAGVDVD
ncbi:Glycosyl transferase family 8 [Tropicimonas isoalkanivorans]|uniref:Glycosyl transferase family 8 n=2 Tax=Tropicimonas isoalkanivorans TaxID=441112 RepID=A0A1I1Q4Q8_9RHOB|nr:Glycosyl transferase family 8 [Tropicimonas isoalkanivorans]